MNQRLDICFLLLTAVLARTADAAEERLLVFAKANNLLDENIRNATSYLRNFAPEPGEVRR
ncbi:hypothetical protein [Methylobacter sp. YRD-M1]|uniref:hypothetical protein n=1 Tax=Methylobacter sp. YRD-M1 TaxID=2911520 RepID=UPI00227BCADD|nr:hypothetical protein [Methylobacter sp. YRD-M1]WAK02526.1 hypothetical protein LZ558_01685 [Methylobacter sp. YRD-M1]